VVAVGFDGSLKMSNDIPPIEYFLPPLFLEHLETKPPPILYHYTDQEGLLGIISKAELWATNVSYMNDAREFQGALLIADRWLRKTEYGLDDYIDMEIAPDTVPMRKQVAIRMAKALNSITKSANICVVCFCTDGDLLSQWRSYAANSFGYSIGFNSYELKLSGMANVFTLGACIYEIRLQLKIIRQICDYYLQEIVVASYSLDDIIKHFVVCVKECGAFFKDPGFSEEKEWRLVTPDFPINVMMFRKGKSFIIPYGRVRFSGAQKRCISSVRIGPCPHVDLAKSAVRSLLLKHQIDQNVDHSSIPFRDW
jgi:hypothetical protein